MMIRQWIRNVGVAGLATVLLTSAVFAHHGWSSYDEKTPVTVEGTITASTYGNPHGTAKLRAPEGKVWDIVLAPVSRMQARGLTETMLKPGTRATVVGYQHRQTATEMRAENITIDKKKVELR
jgi:hypothetical protein